MFSGYLCVGGIEIGNNARAQGYATTADCPVSWFVEEPCEGLAAALGDPQGYDAANISEAPWYDPDDETTHRFYGVYLTTLGEISSSTRVGSFTEGILDGGTPGRARHSGKTFRVRAWLTALGEDALETGQSWLNAALEAQSCGTHAGGSCGATDITFFTACPPADPDAADRMVRHMHDVICISGPIEIETKPSRDGMHWGRLVEFTLYAGKPWMYGEPRSIALTPTPATVIQDTPFNLVPSPSAELAGSVIAVVTNYATNPSLETDASGWANRTDGTNFTDAMAPGARVTGELAAVGVASYRVQLTTTSAGSAASNAAWVGADQEVNLTARPAGARVSMSIWGAAVVLSGTPVLEDLRVYALWRATSGGAALRTDFLGTIPKDGGALSVKSLLPPAGANFVLFRIQAPITEWQSGNVVNLYADAMAVTVP